MNPDVEIPRLRELMPASGRMVAEIVSQPSQRQVILAPMPRPWQSRYPVNINLQLWARLPEPQRDLAFLRQVCWLTAVRLLKPDLYQGLTVVGVAGALIELVQLDAVGALTAGGLGALAGVQAWRSSRGPRAELRADEAAVQVALRRGYSEADAARHLLASVESIAYVEGRSGLSFVELIRSQNLRTLAGLSAVPVPDELRSQR